MTYSKRIIAFVLSDLMSFRMLNYLGRLNEMLWSSLLVKLCQKCYHLADKCFFLKIEDVISEYGNG